MSAGRGFGSSRARGELASGQRLPAHQRGQHGGARGVADQRCHLDHICRRHHGQFYRGTLSLGKQQQFGIGRTIREVSRDRVATSIDQRRDMIKRLRVEPISSYLERRRKGPIYPVIVANGFVYLSGLPPFDPETGDIKQLPFER
jgi:enamine deaminase RidA (YjgF/YER057c/UK114 family)